MKGSVAIATIKKKRFIFQELNVPVIVLFERGRADCFVAGPAVCSENSDSHPLVAGPRDSLQRVTVWSDW
jgi:hypothetical protein